MLLLAETWYLLGLENNSVPQIQSSICSVLDKLVFLFPWTLLLFTDLFAQTGSLVILLEESETNICSVQLCGASPFNSNMKLHSILEESWHMELKNNHARSYFSKWAMTSRNVTITANSNADFKLWRQLDTRGTEPAGDKKPVLRCLYSNYDGEYTILLKINTTKMKNCLRERGHPCPLTNKVQPHYWQGLTLLSASRNWTTTQHQ